MCVKDSVVDSRDWSAAYCMPVLLVQIQMLLATPILLLVHAALGPGWDSDSAL